MLSHLGMNEVNTQLLQKISNHKDKKMVDRYVKLNEDVVKKRLIMYGGNRFPKIGILF